MCCLLETAQNNFLSHPSKFTVKIYPAVRGCITFVVDVESLTGPTKEDVTGGWIKWPSEGCSSADISVIN